jgi:ATP adenylyltransferase
MAYALLNLYPYTNGHVLVTPYRHLATPAEMTAEEALEVWSLVNASLEALGGAMAPHGANVGLNLGLDAGAGMAAHLHVHVVPRFRGDTNFMASLAETRVLPQSLADTWRALRDAWPATDGAPSFRPDLGSRP